MANGGATPANENYRAEQQFTAGWIALRFLHEPAVALAHFARIADGVTNPITLARSYYWQGRAAEALGRGQEARGYYEAAARYPTAYYGQLARARLGIDAVTLRSPPEPPAEHHRLESRARLRDPLCDRRARPRRHHGGGPRRQVDGRRRPGDARRDRRRVTTMRARRS